MTHRKRLAIWLRDHTPCEGMINGQPLGYWAAKHWRAARPALAAYLRIAAAYLLLGLFAVAMVGLASEAWAARQAEQVELCVRAFEYTAEQCAFIVRTRMFP